MKELSSLDLETHGDEMGGLQLARIVSSPSHF